MKKSILNLGTTIDKTQQKQINGGYQCSAHICAIWSTLVLKPACYCYS